MPVAVLVRSTGGILLLEDERDAVSPEIFRGNFIRGMNPDLPGVDVVTNVIFGLLSVVGVVGDVTVMTAGGGVRLSIAVCGGLGLCGSDRASTKSSSSSSSSSEESPPVSWKSANGPPWRERIVPTP